MSVVILAARASAYDGNIHEGATMAVRNMRLMLGLFFLVAGVVLLALRYGAPEIAAEYINNNPTRMLIGALLALVLGGVNIARWYAGWVAFESAATPVRRPLQPDPTAGAETERNPEFDFGRKIEPNEK